MRITYSPLVRLGSLLAILCCCRELHGAEIPSRDGITYTSIFRLIANPAEYDGKVVHFTGYAVIEFENTAVYAMGDAAENGDVASSVWLDFSKVSSSRPKHFHTGYAQITGTFHQHLERGAGHLGLWPASVDQVTAFSRVDHPYNFFGRLDLVFFLLLLLALGAIWLLKSSKGRQQTCR